MHSESYILKPGIRTTTIRPVGNRDIGVTVYGLHPDTRDEAVVQYLNVHGVVNQKEPVIYGVFQGAPGSTLLAGKRNGNRTYMMEVKKNIGSYHIIDGERVSIRYRGQIKTCNKCHKVETECSGKGMAKDWSADRVLLSTQMKDYWEEIGYKPPNTNINRDDPDEKVEEIAAITFNDKIHPSAPAFNPEPSEAAKYTGIVVKGFDKKKTGQDVIKELIKFGLPEEYNENDIQIKEGYNSNTIYIHELKPDVCVAILKNGNGKDSFGKRLSVFTLVEETPTKLPEKSNPDTQTQANPSGKFFKKPGLTSSESSDSENSQGYDTEFDESEFLKRKAKFSPSPATSDQFISVSKKKQGRKKSKADHSPKLR